MAVDTPAKIAVLGAGPIGLEAALYARYLGYDVEVFDRQDVAATVAKARHRRIGEEFGNYASSLGFAALEAHQETGKFRLPANVETHEEWLEKYLIPLSQTDLLADHIRPFSMVEAIGKCDLSKTDTPIGEDDRGGWDFRLLVCDQHGERIVSADVVFDCSGLSIPVWLGHGGVPAVHERECENRINYGVPDLVKERTRFAKRRIVVVGTGRDAKQVLSDLEPLVRETATEVSVIGKSEEYWKQLLDVQTLPGCFRWLTDAYVEEIHADREELTLAIAGDERSESLKCDEVIHCLGYRPDLELWRELQVQTCHLTESPTNPSGVSFAELARRRSSSDWRTTEPNFYVLGEKSLGRTGEFTFRLGLDQIREVFTVLADRADLDLYARHPWPT